MSLALTAEASDIAADFLTGLNPNGSFRYGYTTTLGGAFTLFDTAINSGGVIGWTNPSSFPIDFENNTGSNVTVGSVFEPVGWVNMHPSSDGAYAIIRYVIPSSGAYSIGGTFQGDDTGGTTTDVHILLDSTTSLYSASVSGFLNSHSFSINQNFAAGDTVDFVVGNGGNGYLNDSTGLQGTINSAGGSAVPEPGALWPAGAMLLGMVVYRRRLARKS